MDGFKKYWPFRENYSGGLSPLDEGAKHHGWYLECTGFDSMENHDPWHTKRIELAAKTEAEAVLESELIWAVRPVYKGWDGVAYPCNPRITYVSKAVL